jgi:hypothetical protein
MKVFKKLTTLVLITLQLVVLQGCTVETSSDTTPPNLKLDGSLGSPNGPLDMMINGTYIMGKPRYLVAVRKSFGYSLRFVSDISSSRYYLLCDPSLSYGYDELMGTINIPNRTGMIFTPSSESSVYVNLNRTSAFQHFEGNVNILSIGTNYIDGELDFNTTKTVGTSRWTGAFSAYICN